MNEVDALLEVADLRVTHGGLTALDDLSLSVPSDTVVGLIGPNGAGKTTCIDALTGFTTPTAGHIVFDGETIDGLPPHQRARRGLVRTFQSLELFDDLTVRENLLVGAGVPTWRSTMADLFRVSRARQHTVDEVVDWLGLGDLASARPTGLSNGQRHLVALGRCLAARPKLVLLDEPAAGLDPSETEALGSIVGRIPTLGTSVLLVDHDMALVFGVCDIVHVLDVGRVIASGTPSEVRANPAVIAAYLGASSTPR